MGARETALNALITCRRYEGWSNAVLKDCIRRDKLDARDAALATRLCYGVVQNRGKLDFYLAQLLKGSVKKLHPAVRDILHMGLYQLLELDKIPDSAAVNESVRLARKYGPAGCEKLVNAVLRNAARSKDTLAQPTSFEDKYSHPAELVALLKTALPKGTLESVLQADNQAPETVIQVNTLKTNQEALKKRLEGEGVTAQPHKWMENCLVLSGTGSLEQLPSFREGLYYVQDPASKLSVFCGELKPGMEVLDCCAAPGWPLSCSSAAERRRAGGIFTPSAFVERMTGVDNVCERGAVLAAGGPLLTGKHAGNGVTMALAWKPFRLDWRWKDA